MATNLEQLLVRIDATTEGLRRELKRADSSVLSTQRTIEASTQRIDRAFSGISKTIRQDLVGSLGLLAGAMTIRKVIEYSDTWKQLEGRLRVVTASQAEFNSVQEQLLQMADENRSGISGTINLYSRLAMAVGNNEKAMRNIMPVTEAIAKGIAITGESSASAEGAIVQFAQGLATNFSAAGQEIRSLQEQAPRVAKALADGLNEIGVTSNATAGSLNKLARDGVITAENSMAALASQIGVLREEMAKTPVTVSQALTKLDNAFLKTIGASKALETGTGSLTLAISKLADNLDTVVDVFTLVATIAGGRAAAAMVLYTAEVTKNTYAAIMNRTAAGAQAGAYLGVGAAAGRAAIGVTALTRVMGVFGGPIGLAITGAALAFQVYSSHVDEASEKSKKHADTLAALQGIKKSLRGETEDSTVALKREAESHLATARAALEETKAQVQLLNVKLQSYKMSAKQGGIRGAAASNVARDTGAELTEAQKKATEYEKTIREVEAALEDYKKANPASGAAGLTDAQEKLIKKQKEYRQQLLLTNSQMKQLAEASGESIEKHHELERAITAENEAREQGYKVGTKEFEIVKSQIIQREQLKEKIEANIDAHEKAVREAEEMQKRYAEALMQPFEHAFENVQDELANMLMEGKLSFESLANIAKKLAAEVAAAWIIRPIMASTLSSLGLGSITGGAGGTTAAGGMSLNPINAVSSIYSAITGGVGSSLFGTAASGTAAATSGLVGTGGSFLGSTALASGLSIGLPLAAIAIPLISSIFGKKPSSKLQGGNINLNGGGVTGLYGLTGNKFSQENQDAASGLLQVGQGVAKALAQITGETFKQNLRIEVGGRDGIGIAIGDAAQKNFKEAGDALKALTLGITGLADQSNEAVVNLNTAINNIDFSKAEAAMKDIEFALNFDSLGDLPKTMSEVEAAVTEMTRQFDEAEETTRRLGLSVAKLAQYEENRATAMRNSYMQGASRDLLGMLAPNELAKLDEQQRYIQQLKDLTLLNASAKDLKVAEILHQTRMKQLTEDINELQASGLVYEQNRLQVATDLANRYSSIGQNLKKFIFDLEYGQYSNETPVQNLANIRAMVQSLGERSANGDADASEQLADLLPAFLELSGEVNGFNAQFAADRNLALAVSKSTLSTAERQVQIQTQIASAAQAQIEVLQKGFASLEEALKGTGLSAGDVLNSATGNSDLLKPGETVSVLTQPGATGLPVAVERSIKNSILKKYGYTISNAPDIFRNIVTNESDREDYRRQIRSKGGVPEFFVGGQVRGQRGVDKIDAKLTDEEFVTRTAAVRSIGVQNMHYMNATGRLPANDMGGLESKMDTLIGAVKKLTMITAADGNAIAGQLSGMQKELSSIRSDAGLAASSWR